MKGKEFRIIEKYGSFYVQKLTQKKLKKVTKYSGLFGFCYKKHLVDVWVFVDEYGRCVKDNYYVILLNRLKQKYKLSNL